MSKKVLTQSNGQNLNIVAMCVHIKTKATILNSCLFMIFPNASCGFHYNYKQKQYQFTK